jgi:hypothetical protein
MGSAQDFQTGSDASSAKRHVTAACFRPSGCLEMDFVAAQASHLVLMSCVRASEKREPPPHELVRRQLPLQFWASLHAPASPL